MSTLSQEDIRHLSHLARLELTEDEAVRYAAQLSSVVGYVEQLQAVPTQQVKSVRGVSGLENMFAEDINRSSNDPCAVNPKALLAATPLHEGDYIEVRAVLGDEGGAA